VSLIDRLRRRLAGAGLARHDEMEGRFSDEMRFHLEMHIARGRREGLSADEARRAALVAFGAREFARDEARDAWGHPRVEELRQDVRFALRTLRRSPLFTAAAVGILAIGLGATTMIFSVVDHILLRPLPYPHQERLIVARESIKEIADQIPVLSANASHYLAWRQSCTACEQVAAMRLAPMTLTDGAEPVELAAVRATANVFPMLGLEPFAGRFFTDAEDESGVRVVVLGHRLWQTRFGGDRRILGRTLNLAGAPATVVGILPADMVFPQGRQLGTSSDYPAEPDIVVPLSLNARERITPGEFDYAVIVRLKEGATVAQASAQLQALQRSVASRAGVQMTLSAVVTPLQEQMVGQMRRPLTMLLAAGVGVLLIVCTNLANLLVARNVEREREAAVRLAMGAGRARLIRQLVTESVVLALCGGVLGLALSSVGLASLLRLAPADLPRLDEVHIDARVVLAGVIASVIAGVAFGTLPALRFGRTDPASMLRGSGKSIAGGKRLNRTRDLLVGAQVAISTVLLVTTGLLLASLVHVLGADRGFSAQQVLAMDVVLPRVGYDSASRRAAFFDDVLARAKTLPGATDAAIATAVPLEGEVQTDLLSYENDHRPPTQRPVASIRKVAPSYLSTLGVRLVRGRMFDDRDRGAPVVVLSERAARSLWPNESAIGKRVVPGSNDPLAEVIGVVADVRTTRLEEEGAAIAYLPYWQQTPSRATVLLRTQSDAAAMTAALRSVVREAGATVAISKVRTIAAIVDRATAARRFQLLLIGFFGVVALVTAAVGVYAMIAHSLSRRTREIAIRIAVGAQPADLHRLAFREGMTPVIGGLLVGAIASWAAAHAVASLLYGARPGDPATLSLVALIIVGIGLVACWVPSRRATKVGAATALRLE
jgi:predicted permease